MANVARLKFIAKLGISYMPRRSTAGTPLTRTIQNPLTIMFPEWISCIICDPGKNVEPSDADFMFSKYPQAIKIQQCILDYRKIYNEKEVILVERFIKQYPESIDSKQ